MALFQQKQIRDVETGFYLSDEGTTYAELDKIFELEESDVIKNLVACQVSKLMLTKTMIILILLGLFSPTHGGIVVNTEKFIVRL